jgi:hypothetical protein
MKSMVRGFFKAMMLVIISANLASAQFQYIFPKDNSQNNFPNTHLILRNGELMDESSVTSNMIELTGSQSGVVAASVVLSTDGKTVCIAPASPFKYGETVTAKVKDGFKTLSGQILTGTSFDFSVRKKMTEAQQQQLEEYLNTHDDDGNLLNDPNQQSIYVPHEESSIRQNTLNSVIIYTNNNPAPGELFFHRNSGASTTASSGIGYGIMTSSADSIFYRASTTDGSNFRLNLNGYLTAFRLSPGVDSGIIVLDSGYNEIDVVHGQNGLVPTQHEHLFFPDGTKWFTCYDWQGGWDLSQYGGAPDAIVNVSWIQGLDADDNVIFEWRSDEHFQVTDATPDILLSTSTVDPWHINSMDKDADGNFICSFRNMDRIVKINMSDGSIIWHWGGINSTYTDFSSTNCGLYAFSHQHNVHRIENGNILMFDNGNSQPIGLQVSQPKEYVLDEVNHTATCVWYYTHPQVMGQNMYTKNQGSVMRLPNGNTLIGYGLPNFQGLPNGTEIDVNNQIVWEFRFKDSTEYTYRLYKFEWSPSVGVNDIDKSETNLQIFPNPSNGLFNLSINLRQAAEVSISIVNLLGEEVYSSIENYHSGMNTSALELTELNKGFYFVHISSGELKMSGRILIQ